MGPNRFGALTDSAIGILFKEYVRRAIAIIRKQEQSFKWTEKPSLKQEKDYFTTADTEVQELCVKWIRESFPEIGIIGEEADPVSGKSLFIPCILPGLYITLDPLDGTKAFMRRQSHGIGTMFSLIDVTAGEVLAAFVGDVKTREVYGYRPGSAKVRRIYDYESAVPLVINDEIPLREQVIVLREDQEKFRPLMGKLAMHSEAGGLFKKKDMMSGSIGITFARLWKSEVGGILLPAGPETPWDRSPVIGITKKMGFVFLSIRDGKFAEENIPISTEIVARERETLVIHRSRMQEAQEWLALNM